MNALASPPAQASGCSTGWFGKMLVGQKQGRGATQLGRCSTPSPQSRHPPLPYKTSSSWRLIPAGKRNLDTQPASNILNQVCSRVSLAAQLVKNPPAMTAGFNPWVRTIPSRRERLPTPIFWPGEAHGLYNLWGFKESDMTEQLSLSLSLIS